jgi:hypothetical protein
VADHLSVLLFLCLIFHNLQLAGASSGMVAVAAKQKRVTFHAVWLEMNNRTEATLLQSGKLQVIPFSPPGFLFLSFFYLSAKANFRFDGVLPLTL